jgi:hypothetical protein
MKTRHAWTGLIALSFFVLAAGPAAAQRVSLETLAQQVQTLTARLTTLETENTRLKGLLKHISVIGNDIFITGANLHVVNSLNETDSKNGLGNVIIGYNEPRGDGRADRSGSHMLVVGQQLNYGSFGGIVVGQRNTASGEFSSVSGGEENTASGGSSSVSGGRLNVASGFASSVSGGEENGSGERFSSVSGGRQNVAGGFASSVSGGERNTASERSSSVSGGHINIASGSVSSVSGGEANTASERSSSVSGGISNVAGAFGSSVSGGARRSVDGQTNWRAGELFQAQ